MLIALQWVGTIGGIIANALFGWWLYKMPGQAQEDSSSTLYAIIGILGILASIFLVLWLKTR